MQESYRFLNFKLLPQERLLLRRGVEVTLGSRAFDVLQVLVRHSRSLVTKDALLAQAWRGVVVEESNLPVQIKTLRNVLGKQAITTVSGRGYRLELEVWTADMEPTPPERSPHPGISQSAGLPLRIPPTIGRDAELEALGALIQSEALLTLCGAAGMGKTQLALALGQQVQRQAQRDVHWVELAALRQGEQIPTQIARAIGLPLPDSEPPLHALLALLKPRNALLILDNCEHLAGSVKEVVQALLQATEGITVLATSQVPLFVAQEQVYRLQPLQTPAPDCSAQEAQRTGAVALFLSRLRALQRNAPLDMAQIPDIVRICRALDGNPLAICLAAARVPAMGTHDLLVRLDERLQLLAPGRRDPPSRGNALQCALEWSEDLLLPDEKLVFRKLGVFAGGFALDWAVLCVMDTDIPATRAAEIILELVDRSLLSVLHTHATPRYFMSESCRLYALHKLEEMQNVDTPQHCFCKGVRWILDEAYEEAGLTPDAAWLARYEPELANLRSALRWSLQHDHEMAVALVGSAWPLWLATGLVRECQTWCDLVEHLLVHSPGPLVQARYWEAVAQSFAGDDPLRSARAAAKHTEMAPTAGT